MTRSQPQTKGLCQNETRFAHEFSLRSMICGKAA